MAKLLWKTLKLGGSLAEGRSCHKPWLVTKAGGSQQEGGGRVLIPGKAAGTQGSRFSSAAEPPCWSNSPSRAATAPAICLGNTLGFSQATRRPWSRGSWNELWIALRPTKSCAWRCRMRAVSPRPPERPTLLTPIPKDWGLCLFWSWEKLWSPLVVMPPGVCPLTSGEVSEKQNLVVSPSPGRK